MPCNLFFFQSSRTDSHTATAPVYAIQGLGTQSKTITGHCDDSVSDIDLQSFLFSAVPVLTCSSSRNMASRRAVRRSHVLEVERKFRALAVSELTQRGGVPPFQSLRQLPTKTIHDTYYDLGGVLSSAGSWVRLRNGAWQAKVRKGGGFLNSRFEELYGADNIADHVRSITGWDMANTKESSSFGLQPTAAFETRRQAWTANLDFQIVLDTMDFGHEVGEVELQHTLEGVEGEGEEAEEAYEAYEAQKTQIMQQMDERIVDFMKTYSWAFAAGEPKGKLTAYFERLQKAHK